MRHWRLLILALVLLILAVTAFWWAPPLLTFAEVNSNLIQSLESLLAILLGLSGLITGWLGWRQRQNEQAANADSRRDSVPQVKVKNRVETGGGDYVGASQNKAQIEGDVLAPVIVGDGGTINNNPTTVIQNGRPKTNPDELRRSYLNYVFETAGILQLSGIDPKAARESSANLSLSAVYTALLTQTTEDQERMERAVMPERSQKKRSALEQLNQYPRLVLLGEPGSGKSTFVNFVALCLAGEALEHSEANLSLLTSPLPQEEGEREEPKPQPWKHRALLPVRVVLRDFAARGLPAAGEAATAKHLWEFIAKELDACDLSEYARHMNIELRERGGLLLVDGLDEVPGAEQRRVQIKQAVEGFARSYPKVRILVTSRTYAYQNQDWQLNGFQTAILAPFSRAQIDQFITRWYDQVAAVRGMNEDDAQGRAGLLRRAIFGSDRLMGLAERPLLLTLMASLHAWRGGSLPEKREELYADTVDLLLDSWESQRVMRGPKGELVLAQPSLVEWLKVDRQKVRDLLNALAFQAHSAQPELVGTADIPQAQLVNGLMRVANNPDVNPSRLVEFLRDRAGLLLPRGDGVFTFPHRTFQEYLAACYLTDHDYPDTVADLACGDFNRWREAALLAAAKAGRGSASTVWALVEALCDADVKETSLNEACRLWGAHLAGQVLVESADLEKANERNRRKVERVRGWLVHILRQEEMPTRERAAGSSLAKLGDPRFRADVWYLTDDPLLGFVEIPAGPFLMGSDIKKDGVAFKNEQPQHTVHLPRFWIGRYPVTVAQYRAFVEDSGYKTTYAASLRRVDNHPVVLVTWHDALGYCQWLTEKLRASSDTPESLRSVLQKGGQVALPSEVEWEKAARGMDGRIYPWGDDFDSNKANTDESRIGETSAVGCFPGGASPYGVEEMSGNVWEWTRSISKAYPYDPRDGERENLRAGDNVARVLRGGSWSNNGRVARCASRNGLNPNDWFDNVGFRVVVLPSNPLNSNSSGPLML